MGPQAPQMSAMQQRQQPMRQQPMRQQAMVRQLRGQPYGQSFDSSGG
jgi:hypothetical protein